MFRVVPRRILAAMIVVYQNTLSPDHAFWVKAVFPYGYCKFHPSCSEYARAAILRDGVIFGSIKSISRVFRCNPWSRGGVDEP